MQRVVVLKDQTNKKEHEGSAQIACEGAGAIKTIASLTREQGCYEEYSKSLEVPLRRSNRTAIWSCAMFALSQCISFLAIALVGDLSYILLECFQT
jgi:ATP-binding cassette subfamily B (MDR/TAP) protein 1